METRSRKRLEVVTLGSSSIQGRINKQARMLSSASESSIISCTQIKVDSEEDFSMRMEEIENTHNQTKEDQEATEATSNQTELFQQDITNASTSYSQKSSSLNRILSDLRGEKDEYRQMEALSELCEILSMATEDSLSFSSVESFVPILVEFLSHESNAENMLLSARALTHLCDVLPQACASLVHYGAIPSFCARLLAIEYMDLAEQSLEALEKISHEHPVACLRAGGLMAVLSYLDFFSTSIQRVALSTAANICKKLPSDASDYVMDAVPILTNLLNYHDSKVVENASLCLTRIVACFSQSSEKLDELCNYGLVEQIVKLISSNSLQSRQTSLSIPTYMGLIRILSKFARGSTLAIKTLLDMNISGIARDILSNSNVLLGIPYSSALSGPSDQIHEILNLLNELLPSVPEGKICFPKSLSMNSKCSMKENFPGENIEKLDDLCGEVREGTSHEKLFSDQPDLLVNFGMDIIPILVQICSYGMSSCIHHKCITVFGKLVFFSNTDMVVQWHHVTNIPSFLAGILSGKDLYLLAPALQISEVLLEKSPDTFWNTFVKEGVVHAIDALLLRLTEKTSSDRSKEETACTTISKNEDTGHEKRLITSKLDNCEMTYTLAKQFQDKYYPLESTLADARQTERLSKLQKLCMKLKSALSAHDNDKSEKNSSVSDECLSVILSDMLREIAKDEGISTFELIQSDLVSSLLEYFLCGTLSKESGSSDRRDIFQKALRRFNQFTKLTLANNGVQEERNSLIILIQKLQEALSLLECFPVILSDKQKWRGDNTRILSSLSMLCRPVKLCFCRDEGEKFLKDYSSNIILIESLATLDTIEEFLWPRLQIGNNSENLSPNAAASGGIAQEPGTMDSERCGPARSSLIGARGISDNVLGTSDVNRLKGKQKVDAEDITKEKQGSQAAAIRSFFSSESKRITKGVSNNAFEGNTDDCVSTEEEDFDKEDDQCTEHSEELTNVQVSGNLPPISRRSLSLSRAAMSGHLFVTCRNDRGSRDSQILPLTYSGTGTPKLKFFMGGKEVDRFLTVCQLIQTQGVTEEDGNNIYIGSKYAPPSRRKMLDNTYYITYKRCLDDAKHPGDKLLCYSEESKSRPASSDSSNLTFGEQSLFLESVLKGELPCDLDKSNGTYSILLLLRILEGLNQLAPRLHALEATNVVGNEMISIHMIPCHVFLSNKLTVKLLCQMQDPLTLCSRGMPSWCHQVVRACPFLFPFESRKQFFYSVTFGLSHTIHGFPQQQHSESSNVLTDREAHIGRVQRQKVSISRNHILDSAMRVMEMYCSQKTFLEVEFFGEVGTGLGPTLEFYTLLSHEFQKQGLGMWRSDPLFDNSSSETRDMQCSKLGDTTVAANETSGHTDKSENYVLAPQGLFPRPLPPSTGSSLGSPFPRVLQLFRLLGRVTAKALKDGRFLDLKLSPAFYKLVLGQELDLFDIRSFDPEVGATLENLYALVQRRHIQEPSYDSSRSELSDLHIHDAKLDELCLDFTLPGYPDYILKPMGQNLMVNSSNLGEYLSLVVDASVKTGIHSQMESFRDGFNEVFPISQLRIFSVLELESLLCGSGHELWTARTLAECIIFDHGYTASSPPVIHLLEILGEFTPAQQRAFMRFVTGSPRLPPGGLAALNPKLTIVRKHLTIPNGESKVSSSQVIDKDLPSVMTCANYLKLPPYSSKEVMRERLLYAITEGQGSFDLS